MAHDHHHHDHAPHITVYHATAPTCWWSWGYEAVLNRIRLVYGDQVPVKLLIGCTHESWAQWKADYEVHDQKEMDSWHEEALQFMGVPLARLLDAEMPDNVMPVSLAAIAAREQGEDAAHRFMRATLRMLNLEKRDPTTRAALMEAAREARLDTKKFEADLANETACREEMGFQGEGFPHVPVSYYNLVLSDGHGRTVLLDYAFDPKVVEDAIDWLAGGKLAKAKPTDVAAYLRENPHASLREIARVFALGDKEAEAKLLDLEKVGKAKRVTLAGAPHWTAA